MKKGPAMIKNNSVGGGGLWGCRGQRPDGGSSMRLADSGTAPPLSDSGASIILSCHRPWDSARIRKRKTKGERGEDQSALTPSSGARGGWNSAPGPWSTCCSLFSQSASGLVSPTSTNRICIFHPKGTHREGRAEAQSACHSVALCCSFCSGSTD